MEESKDQQIKKINNIECHETTHCAGCLYNAYRAAIGENSTPKSSSHVPDTPDTNVDTPSEKGQINQ